MYRHLLGLFFIFLVISNPLFAQETRELRAAYIEQYKDLAIKHRDKYKIPASITLAQGILESGSGESDFVKDSRNHFGIKCGSDWKGAVIYHTDDKKDECFRQYDDAEDSYEDHSLFLTKRSRYSSLFDLHIADYKAWAIGLQTCGYATDKAYANKLIKIIEDHKLYEFDTNKSHRKNKPGIKSNPFPLKRDIYKTFGLIYVIAGSNDSFEKIAGDLGFKTEDLIRYNEVPEDFPLFRDDIVYLEKKKKKADKPYFEHVVQVGESMHSISQKYGLQLSRLYKLNRKAVDYVPEEGDILKLR
jgi:LysM repeat protein